MVVAGASGLTEVVGRVVFWDVEVGPESEFDIYRDQRGLHAASPHFAAGTLTKAPEVHTATTHEFLVTHIFVFAHWPFFP